MYRVLALGALGIQRSVDLERLGCRVIRLADVVEWESAGFERALKLFDGRPPELIVADFRLPKDVLNLRRLKWLLRDSLDQKGSVPCLGLVGPSFLQVSDLLELVDDFMGPPYERQEFSLRIKHLMGRATGSKGASIVEVADIKVDLTRYSARDSGGKELCLTPREMELLRFLCVNRGKYFDRSNLVDLVWGLDYAGGVRSVDIHVCRLRSKLPPKAAALLRTLRGVGYGFADSA
jgi:two-component system, OmpR family, alkaline phosphatase synthesis response regulator PhoP